ncbi:Primosomal replication protein N prime prime [Klebsiella pneumoniae subsp. pneumoniae ST258-K28BO]|nr:Primosomal replication protein N prime prime [Klebsiella pneumoniae subsp. pneumoniae ST258-K28BO]
MKTAQLLQTLNDQLSELAALVAPLAEHATLSPRFDRQLFHTRSTLMQAYLAEAQHNFNQLRQAVERQQLPQVVWIAERLAAQIAALRRETATLSRWQRRRLQHQEYERRLLAMRDQRQRQLAQATSLDEQQRLGKEVEAYSGRLARCRQALDKIENVLARLTR